MLFDTNFLDIYNGMSHPNIVIAVFLINCVLRGFAYKKLYGNYLGFIPIFGDIIFMDEIAKEFQNKYRTKYKLWACIVVPFWICIVIPFLPVIILLIDFIKMYGDYLWIICLGIPGFCDMFSEWKTETPAEFVNNCGSALVLGLIVVVVLLVIVVMIVSVLLNRYYRYRLLKPLVQRASDNRGTIMKTLFFSLVPLTFYLWVIAVKNVEDKILDNN